MATEVRVGNEIFSVEDNVAEKAAFDLIDRKRTPEEVRTYLLRNKVTTPRLNHPLGYVDFEELENGNPKVPEGYYRIHTTYGRKLHPPKDITRSRF